MGARNNRQALIAWTPNGCFATRVNVSQTAAVLGCVLVGQADAEIVRPASRRLGIAKENRKKEPEKIVTDKFSNF